MDAAEPVDEFTLKLALLNTLNHLFALKTSKEAVESLEIELVRDLGCCAAFRISQLSLTDVAGVRPAEIEIAP